MADEGTLTSARPPVASGDVHVWRFSPDATRDFETCWHLLSPVERERASRLTDIHMARRFVVGRATVRHILALYLGCNASAIAFTAGLHGKPAVLNDPVYVNWSHSGARWLLALASSGPVGIDLEQVDASFDWRGPASIAFHPNEQRFVDTGAITRDQFYRVWVRKEALFKGHGLGLNNALAGISVADRDGALRDQAQMPDRSRWFLADVRTDPGYAAALATSFPISRQVALSPDLAMAERMQ
jgi:4'-phosphopantetheinyl transferase